MIGSIIKKIVGSKNERELKRLQPLVDKINALEPQMQALSDTALAATTVEFRERLERGASLDELLPEAFAVIREAGQACARHAPFRRAADRRHGPAPRQDRRDEDRRREDPGGDPAGLSQRPDRQGGACRHRQRLPGQSRLRMDGADSTGSSACRSGASSTA